MLFIWFDSEIALLLNNKYPERKGKRCGIFTGFVLSSGPIKHAIEKRCEMAMSRRELGASLNLKVELIDSDKPNRSGRTISPDYITVHNTSNANAGANADAHSRFVRNKGFYTLASGKKNNVSWHYTVDDTQVIKHLPVNERAIHAGRGNGVSIAIEICMHAEIDQAAANLRASRLIAVLMHDLHIDKANVKPHKFWTGKNCPTLLLHEFDGFCSSCDNICQSLVDLTEAIQPVGDPEPVDLTVTRDEMKSIKMTREMPEEAIQPEDPDEENEHEIISVELEAFITTN